MLRVLSWQFQRPVRWLAGEHAEQWSWDPKWSSYGHLQQCEGRLVACCLLLWICFILDDEVFHESSEITFMTSPPVRLDGASASDTHAWEETQLP